MGCDTQGLLRELRGTVPSLLGQESTKEVAVASSSGGPQAVGVAQESHPGQDTGSQGFGWQAALGVTM